MYVEILSGRRIQIADGTICYGEEQIVEALVGHFFPLASSEMNSEQTETQQIVGQLFDAMEEKILEELQTETDDSSIQVAKLGLFILRHVPGEPCMNEGAVDTAIRIIDYLQKQVAAKDAVNLVLKAEVDARTSSLVRIENSVQQLLAGGLIPTQPARILELRAS